ncbi:MAG: SMP-30/gluconolactonase/LRE family protein [Polyangiaceae bacterium]|nr:SMP-30/gluconolactonase/LRE family protein [Polyangiaceae bacterium]
MRAPNSTFSNPLPFFFLFFLGAANACTKEQSSAASQSSTGGASTSSTLGGGGNSSTSSNMGGAPGGSGGAGGSDAGGGAGGTPQNPNCAIPAGAPPNILEGKVAPGLVCTRFPTPLVAPRDVTIAPNGNVYATEMGGGRIVQWTPNGYLTIAEGLIAPIGLRVAPDGNLLVAEEGFHTVAKIDIDTGQRTVIADVGHNVTYLTLGPDGAAYVSSFQELANTQKGIVYRVNLSTQVASPFATGLNVPEGLFFDEQNRLHVAEWLLPSAVYRYTPGGGDITTASQVGSGYQNIYGVTSDTKSGFFAADHAGKIVHVHSDGTSTDVLTNIGRPGGLWFTGTALWIAEFVDFGQTGSLLRVTAF